MQRGPGRGRGAGTTDWRAIADGHAIRLDEFAAAWHDAPGSFCSESGASRLDGMKRFAQSVLPSVKTR